MESERGRQRRRPRRRVCVRLARRSAPRPASAGSPADSSCCRWFRRAPPNRARPPPAPASRPVCVRLCDGFFFPVPASAAPIADAESVCRAVCPAAGVALYYLPATLRSDRRRPPTRAASPIPPCRPPSAIAPPATPACGCRRAGEPGLAYWRDPTLKTGDAVMTAERRRRLPRRRRRRALRGRSVRAGRLGPARRDAAGRIRRAERRRPPPTRPKATRRRSAKRGAPQRGGGRDPLSRSAGRREAADPGSFVRAPPKC